MGDRSLPRTSLSRPCLYTSDKTRTLTTYLNSPLCTHYNIVIVCPLNATH